MHADDLVTRYNYDAFVPDKFEPWMNFANSPVLGQSRPDFPLWTLDEAETSLATICAENLYTIVEFGSFT
ncbi:hypothetical protein GC175_30435 [bacterium]|nr:hypothetical protein [bacterium]